jgi:hypothetical protein
MKRFVVALLLLLLAGCDGWYLRTTGHGNPVDWYRHQPASRPAVGGK